jgi:hypothetical protein
VGVLTWRRNGQEAAISNRFYALQKTQPNFDKFALAKNLIK